MIIYDKLLHLKIFLLHKENKIYIYFVLPKKDITYASQISNNVFIIYT